MTSQQISKLIQQFPTLLYSYFALLQWKSKHPNATLRIGWQNQTRVASNIDRFTGGPSNILVGYTLLSKYANIHGFFFFSICYFKNIFFINK